MKKNILKYTTIALFSINLFSSCSKDFDALPGNQITEETLFANEEGFKAATNGLYATLQNQYYYGGSIITITELYTPYSAPGGYDDATLTNIYDAATGDIKLEATNPRLRNIWVSIYNTIRACNVLLSKGNNGKPSVITDEAMWNNLKGQALGIRALAHFDLLRLFGEHWNFSTSSQYGIPVITTVPTASDKPKRNTVVETYNAILKDLDDAYVLLSGDNKTNPIEAIGSGKNYVDSMVIKALKARVLLYKGDKTEAATLAQDVIDNSGITLTKDLTKYYAARNSGEESIFELSFSNQNPSKLNLTTYKNATAFINDLIGGVDITNLNDNYFSKTGDVDKQRALLFENDDRTIKYKSLPALQNNPAYIIRLSEMYLILAEANNFDFTKLTDLRSARDVNNATTTNDNEGMFAEIVAELNFEGAHTMCARARLNINDFKTNGKGIFPIPQAELLANSNMTQNPNY